MSAIRQALVSTLCLLTMAALTANSDFCLAQIGGESMYWKKIQEKDAKIKKIEVVWLQTRVDAPIEGLNAEKSAAYTEAQRRMQDVNIKPDELRQMTLGVVKSSQNEGVWHRRVTFLSNGSTVRAEILDARDQPMDKQAPEQMSHSLDISDGTNIVQIMGYGQEIPIIGVLTREASERLSLSAAGPIKPILLFAQPITQVYTIADSTIKDLDSNHIQIEHMLPYKSPLLSRIILSKSDWRPRELFVLSPNNMKVTRHFTLSGYKEYEGGITFPSLVTETVTNKMGKQLSYSEYHLNAVRFNDQVSNQYLENPIPKGTNISDYRFGREVGIRYRFDSVLPSDKYVHDTINVQKQIVLNEKRQKTLLNLGLGLGCVGLSALTLRRIRKQRKTGA